MLNIIDKSILSAIFTSTMTQEDPIEIVKNRTHLSDNIINEKIDGLKKNGLVENDKLSLTDLGRTSLRVILAGGVFDIIHPGHIHTLNAAKALGDVLVVVVATDSTAEKMKKRIPLHKQEQRRDLVKSLSMVDLCVIGKEGDIFKTVEVVKPEIIALGYDQVHQEKFITDGCKKLNLNVKVARLQSPVPEISSSEIEKEYG
ncbi:MAG: adenylyltransferase/cytidyltransferase family protein, partial [Nitrosopumilaceae archaeon]